MSEEELKIFNKMREDIECEHQNNRALNNQLIKAIAEAELWRGNFEKLKESSTAAVYQLDDMIYRLGVNCRELIIKEFSHLNGYDQDHVDQQLSKIIPARLPRK